MISLKNKHQNQRALVIFGGPSIVANRYPLQSIDKSRYTVFLESKALTPYFLKSGLVPDYYLMFFLEKCKSNAFQHVVFQSFLADIKLDDLLREQFLAEYHFMKDHFDMFFEPFRPHKGPHKKYRYRPDVFLKNSPLDLLANFPGVAGLSIESNFQDYAGSFSYQNPVHKFHVRKAEKQFDLDDYFHVDDEGDIPSLKDYSFLNSAAIALFPILKYLGFDSVFFLGMDMSMLGSMEFAACYTFKSMKHYEKFFKKAQRVFNASFRENKRKFMRPPYDFEAVEQILSYRGMTFLNIYEPFEYAMPVPGIRSISFKEFLNGTVQ